MPKLQQTAVATTTEEIKLEPKVRRALLAQLRRYEALATEIKALKEQAKGIVAKVRELREATGYGSLDIEGFKTTNVPGTQRYLDKKLFVQLGGSLAMLENATRSKPKKPYEKITCPGATDEESDD